ncbi:hypothetical protein BDV28DRAFT_157047 [Aspergillus coremiiformis]|uniref:Rhodopsin domain-containing protein n=1 Tax=Aspergillus coremiiformis TaxID=138285 RepID=A0A5N6ZBK0_9EURO|nr:hypothetical protein BDV28DRAFT_157047 [Aspergillus coremiiformis]
MAELSGSASGGKGGLVLGVTWAEAGLALLLFALRARTASRCPPEIPNFGLFGLRWDFIWVVITLARTTSIGRIVLYTVGAIQGILNVIEVALILTQCDPIEKLWDSDLAGTCDNVLRCAQVGFLQGSMGAAADCFLAIYPMYIIGRLQHMKPSTKIGLCLTMSGGLVAGIAGINQTIAITSISHDDLTYSIYKLNTWVLTEMWFIIIFGSIPVLRPVFVRFTQDLKLASGSRNAGKHSKPSNSIRTSRQGRDSWIHFRPTHRGLTMHRLRKVMVLVSSNNSKDTFW